MHRAVVRVDIWGNQSKMQLWDLKPQVYSQNCTRRSQSMLQIIFPLEI